MNKNLALLALTGILTLASCSQDPIKPTDGSTNPGGNTPVNHTLNVLLNGDAKSGTFTVRTPTGESKLVDVVDGKGTITLSNAKYTVIAPNLSGYTITPSSQAADLTTSDATVTFTSSKGTTVTPKAVGGITLVNILDDNGKDLPSFAEVNDNKNATLFAAQAEENVCVAVKVTDVDGNPLSNANVTVTSTGNNISITSCGKATAQAITAGQSGAITTDANGVARIRLFAVSGNAATEGPVKFVVSADSNGVSVNNPLELKGFFLNMTHLYVSENGDDRRGGKDITRIGGNVGTYNNVFKDGFANEAHFIVDTNYKQPQYTEVPLDIFGEGFGKGLVYYTLSGADAAKVRFDKGTHSEDYVNAAGQYVDVVPFNGVTVVPNKGITRADVAKAPINIDLKANYRFTVTYGENADGTPHNYDFELKDISWHKTWSTSFLKINKWVDNHVLTWQGAAHTLGQHGSATDPFTTTVHVKVENNSQSTSYNTNIRDVLPAELGYVDGSGVLTITHADKTTTIVKDAATYDATLHAVNVNNTGKAALDQLKTGESAELTFKVYARQKPGFKWEGTVPNTAIGSVPTIIPTGTPYADPYRVINGDYSNDVTVSYTDTAAANGQQHIQDYQPVGDESDIWVVRPLLGVYKRLASEPVVRVGGQAAFDITAVNLDRVALGQPGYVSLASRYPGEFNGTVRSNPYAIGIKVTDNFAVTDKSLDFFNATAFYAGTKLNTAATKVSDEPTTSGQAAVDKTVSWNAITLDKPGAAATARVQMNANVVGVKTNCAYLTATNLNQPYNLSGTAYELAPWNGYRLPYGDGVHPWYQSESTAVIAPTDSVVGAPIVTSTPNADGTITTVTTLTYASGTKVVTTVVTKADGTVISSNTSTVPGTTTPAATATSVGLESCANVTVIDGNGLLTLSDRGEYVTPEPQVVDSHTNDGYHVGSTFYYKFDSQNIAPNTTVTGVTATFTKSNNNVTWPASGNYQAIVVDQAGNPVAGYPVVNGTISGNNVVFNGITVPAAVPAVTNPDGSVTPAQARYVRFILPATAARSGDTEVTGVLSYTDYRTGQAVQTKVVVENTTLIP